MKYKRVNELTSFYRYLDRKGHRLHLKDFRIHKASVQINNIFYSMSCYEYDMYAEFDDQINYQIYPFKIG